MILAQQQDDLGWAPLVAMLPAVLEMFKGGGAAAPAPAAAAAPAAGVDMSQLKNILEQLKPAASAAGATMTPEMIQKIVKETMASMQKGRPPSAEGAAPPPGYAQAPPPGYFQPPPPVAGRRARRPRRGLRGALAGIGASASNFISEHSTAFLIGGGVIAALGAGLLIYKKTRRPRFVPAFSRAGQ